MDFTPVPYAPAADDCRKSCGHKSKLLLALAIINIALLSAMLPSILGSSAKAQPRPRGEYVMIPGVATGAPVEIVYVLDTANGEVFAMAPTDRNVLETQPNKIRLANVFQAAMNANGNR